MSNHTPERRKPGPMKGAPRMTEAGRRGAKGSAATRERYGAESVKHERAVDFYASIGRKGGQHRRPPTGLA